MNRSGVERRHEVRSPPHRCGGSLSDSSGSRMVKTLSHESRRGRSVDVNAAAIGTSGPGIRTAAVSDAPFSRRDRDLESVDPLRAGQEHRTGRLARQGLPGGSTVSRDGRERGFKIGIALSKRVSQARLETAGPHLRPQYSSCGMSILTSARSHWKGADFSAPGDFCRPGSKFLPVECSCVACHEQVLSRGFRAEPRSVAVSR